ncbi:MAG: hypothetical protein CMH62_00115 [Nanoarchaeota archaeon]|nr:hypothetical protein [Nanoarchaeota archaeon]
MKKITLITLFVLFLVPTLVSPQSSDELRVCVTDNEGIELPFASLALLQDSFVVNGGIAGFDGCFTFRGLDDDQYEVRISYIGYRNIQTTATLGEVNSFILEIEALTLEPMIVTASRPELQAIISAEIVDGFGRTYGNSDFTTNKDQIIPLHSGDSINFNGEESNLGGRRLFNPDDFTWYFIRDPLEVSQFKDLINRDASSEDFRDFLFFVEKTERDSRTTESFSLTSRTYELIGDFEGQQQFAVLEVQHTEDFFDYEYAYYIQPIDVFCESGRTGPNCGEEIAETRDEGTRDRVTIDEETEISPLAFETCDGGCPEGTTCQYSQCVPNLIRDWACIESDGLPSPENSFYNNIKFGSTCATSSQTEKDACVCFSGGSFTTTCPDGYTHVIEHSCNSANNCQPSYTECPPETYCHSGSGTCKNIDLSSFELALEEIEEDIVLASLGSIPSFETEIVTTSYNDADLIEKAISQCGDFDTDFFSDLEVIETSTPETTASVIAQLTGFFTKITGKQIASLNRVYTSTIETTGYSELAWLELPYLRLGRDNIRFLDRKVGSALLKDFGYTEEIITTAVNSGEPSFSGGTGGLTIRRLSSFGEKIISINELSYDIIFRNSNLHAAQNLPGHSDVFASIDRSRNLEDFAPLQFLYVETNENKFLKIDNEIYSVSKGTYLVPYPFNKDQSYQTISDPTNDPDLRTYYTLASDIPVRCFVIGVDEQVCLPFLTPSDGGYVLRDLPAVTPSLTAIPLGYKYSGDSVRYYVIPLDNLHGRYIDSRGTTRTKDHGDYTNGVYLVPQKNIIIMDNEFSTERTLRIKPNAVYRNVPTGGHKLEYNFDYFKELVDKKNILERKKARDSRPWYIVIRDWWRGLDFAGDSASKGAARGAAASRR